MIHQISISCESIDVGRSVGRCDLFQERFPPVGDLVGTHCPSATWRLCQKWTPMMPDKGISCFKREGFDLEEEEALAAHAGVDHSEPLTAVGAMAAPEIRK